MTNNAELRIGAYHTGVLIYMPRNAAPSMINRWIREALRAHAQLEKPLPIVAEWVYDPDAIAFQGFNLAGKHVATLQYVGVQ